mmetsp:Transcript_18940/g.35330  ORF Transcript_18940/g.35330 Transcript_18940/m.35330 type:complete len:95 (-) Transcript_18940:1524-1808(-)
MMGSNARYICHWRLRDSPVCNCNVNKRQKQLRVSSSEDSLSRVSVKQDQGSKRIVRIRLRSIRHQSFCLFFVFFDFSGDINRQIQCFLSGNRLI